MNFFLLILIGITSANRIGTPLPPPLLVYLKPVTILDGLDQRVVADPPFDTARFRRLLEIQSCLNTLENPAISLNVRADVAQHRLKDFVDAPSPNAQLWQRWLNDDLEWPQTPCGDAPTCLTTDP